MAICIFSDNNEEYTDFIAKALAEFQEHKIHGIAIVALADGEALTGYWNMNLKDKLQAESEVRFDSIDQFMLSNKERYFAANADDDE